MSFQFPEGLRIPSGPIEWSPLAERYPWARAMQGCPQSPTHHAEGDVATHTRMVLEALREIPAWQNLPEEERSLVYAAAVLHDVGKPQCTREEGGTWVSRGHSVRGEVMSRHLLWEMGVPFATREAICALIRWHQHPFWLAERPREDFSLPDGRPQEGAIKLAYRISQSARTDHLAILAEADGRGRICAEPEWLLFKVEEFARLCKELNCFGSPKLFPSDHSRFEYFRTHGRYADYEAYDETRGEAILLCGLAGSGKSTWIARHAADRPVVSLDEVRKDLGILPTDSQAAVIAEARERLTLHLRNAVRGQALPPVWDATALSREFRAPVIEGFTRYQMRTRIVYLEVPPEVLFEQNRAPGRHWEVPMDAYQRMFERWEIPDLTEAHQIDWNVRESA